MRETTAEEAVTSLHDLSAVDLIAGYRAKQFSPTEVLEEVLDHVAAWEPHIKALYLFDPEAARATAKASTDRWQRGESLKAIGRAFGKPSSSIYFLVAPHGGIRPAERRRSRLALTLAEREVISRGITAHQSARYCGRKCLGASSSSKIL
mgnify:CR=1 FL=1